MSTNTAPGSGANTAEPTIRDMLQVIPRECLEVRGFRAFAYLLGDLMMGAGLVFMILTMNSRPWPLALIPSFFLGTILTGLFVIAHDAGHRSFSRSLLVNDLVGHLMTSLVLWPFQVWRISHNVHHRYTHHVHKENAWNPLPAALYRSLPPFWRGAYEVFRTRLFALASGGFAASLICRYGLGRGLTRKEHRQVLGSLIFTLLAWGTWAACATLAGGWRGFVFLIAIPQLVFISYLSTITLLHHTAPDVNFLSPGEWTPSRARLGRTLHVQYPLLFDWLTHSIAWHIPHHVCTAIPHYHLKRAHRALMAAYPELVLERRFTLRYLLKVLSTCQLIRGWKQGGQEWIGYSSATEILAPGRSPTLTTDNAEAPPSMPLA